VRTINVGVIGTGGIASHQHIPALAKQADVKILAVCDVNEAAAKQVAEQFNVPHVFTDYQDLLKIGEIEAVHVCTPNKLHMPPSIDALNAGKHVMVEKPLARNATEGAQMVEAAKKNGKKLMVAQNLRFSPENAYLKRVVESGELGEIYFARVWALRKRGVPSWGVFIDKEAQGGGPLIDIGVHALDLAMHLMGHPQPTAASGMACAKIGNTPGHVGAWGAWDWKNYTVEDYAAAFIRFDNGASMVLESSFCANFGNEGMDVVLLGTKGGLQMNPLKVYGESNGALTETVPTMIPKEGSSYEAEVRAFYDSIQNDTPPPVTGEQALNVMKILDAIYRSGEEGKEVLIG
jgi:predicted dehydrogenase